MNEIPPLKRGLETLNARTVTLVAGELTSTTIRTGADRLTGWIMQIWGYAVTLAEHDFVASTTIWQHWSLDTDPNRGVADWPYQNENSVIMAGKRQFRQNATVNDPRQFERHGFLGAQMFPIPLEVAHSEIYLYFGQINGTVNEDIRLKLYIKMKKVSNEEYLDILENYRS